jgi:hypothetical protein
MNALLKLTFYADKQKAYYNKLFTFYIMKEKEAFQLLYHFRINSNKFRSIFIKDLRSSEEFLLPKEVTKGFNNNPEIILKQLEGLS